MLPVVSTNSKESATCWTTQPPPRTRPPTLDAGEEGAQSTPGGSLDQCTSCLYIVESGGASIMKTKQRGSEKAQDTKLPPTWVSAA